MAISFKELQSEKALKPIGCSEFGKVIAGRAVHAAKADASILMSEEGNVIETSLVQNTNAPCPISVTAGGDTNISKYGIITKAI